MIEDVDRTEEIRLRIGTSDSGQMMAVAYAVRGEDIHVLDVEVVENEEEAHMWHLRVSEERPWINRH